MARRETPAVTAVTRRTAQGSQTVYACTAHAFRVIAEMRKLGDEELQVTAADPARHGCKGCLEDW